MMPLTRLQEGVFAQGAYPSPEPPPWLRRRQLSSAFDPRMCHPCARSKVSPICSVAQTSLVDRHGHITHGVPWGRYPAWHGTPRGTVPAWRGDLVVVPITTTWRSCPSRRPGGHAHRRCASGVVCKLVGDVPPRTPWVMCPWRSTSEVQGE